MNRNEIVEKALKSLVREEFVNNNLDTLLITYGLYSDQIYQIREYMKREDLISEVSVNYIRLTKRGAEIAKNGGWLKHLDIEAKRAKRIKDKEKHDAGYSKWLYEKRWWPIIISIFALLFSAFAIYISFNN